eukprot:g32850.t1
MALLDFETVQDSDESLVVAFSSKAVELIESMDDLASQWPQEELDLRMNVVLPRQGRKRKAKDTSKGGQGKGGASTDDTNAKKNPESALVEKTDKTETEEKEAKGKSKKSKSGKKKRKHLLAKIKKKAIKLKPAPAEKPEIDFTAENLMKNSASDDLIQKELLKLKIAEAKAFKSNPLFSEKDLRRITSKGTEGTPWKHIKTFAYKYFKAEYLGPPSTMLNDLHSRSVCKTFAKLPNSGKQFHSVWRDAHNLPVDPIDAEINEYYLFHGTRPEAANAITEGDFRLDLAGSNAGTLYGRGVYFSESTGKSDEYATEDSRGWCCMLVCRVTLGRILYTDEEYPNTNALVRHCTKGDNHSVLGDREQIRSTFREMIVFDTDQAYPEFLVWYSRQH